MYFNIGASGGLDWIELDFKRGVSVKWGGNASTLAFLTLDFCHMYFRQSIKRPEKQNHDRTFYTYLLELINDITKRNYHLLP